MSSGPSTDTTSNQKQKTNSTAKTQQELDAEQLVQAQQQSLTGTQNVGQTSTQNIGQQSSLQNAQQQSLNTGATTNIGQQATQNTGQQTSANIGSTQNVGTAATQNTGQQQSLNTGQTATQQAQQQATQNTGQQASTNLGATTGQQTSQGLAAAQPMLQQILNTAGGLNTGTNAVENAALQGLTTAAQTNAAQFNPQIAALANDQFAGGGFGAGQQGVMNATQAAQAAYNQALNPDLTGQNNPYLQSLLGNITDRIRNDVGGQFAAAGRSFSGAHAGALSDAMSRGLADPLLQNYWRERDAQTAAAGNLQNSALAQSGELDRIRAQQLSARGQGAQTAASMYDPYNTALQAGNYQASQPINRLGMLGNLATSISGTGGSVNTAGTQAQTGLVNTANQGTTTGLSTGLTNTAQQGLVNTANQGLTNTMDTSNTQNLGMLNTANQGLTNTIDQGTSVNTGMLNSSQQGLVNTANAGLTNTADASLTAATQAANQLTNSNQDTSGKTTTKGKGTVAGTSATQQQSDPFQIGVGLLTGIGGLLSDRRMKEDIEQIGEAFNGLPIYRFRYKGIDGFHIGFMADEVEQRVPEAVETGTGGFKFVNYKTATEGALR
jgi:hypothetical protein